MNDRLQTMDRDNVDDSDTEIDSVFLSQVKDYTHDISELYCMLENSKMNIVTRQCIRETLDNVMSKLTHLKYVLHK